MKCLTDELDKLLNQLKKECAAGNAANTELAEKIERLIRELKRMLEQCGDGSQLEGRRTEELDREEEELKKRLEAAQNRLNEAKKKRAAAAEEVNWCLFSCRACFGT